MKPSEGHKRASGRWILLAVSLFVILGVVIYRPVLDFTFFWEDPFDIGQVETRSLFDLFLVSTNNLYYRPLHLALVKALKGGSLQFAPAPFYVFNVLARIASSLLTFAVARRLTRGILAPLGMALIFLLAPIPYDSTAKAMSAHQALLVPFLLTLWLYLEGRLSNRPLFLGLAGVFLTISLLVHESAILLPFFILSLEFYLLRQGRVSRFARTSLVYLVIVAIFLFVWLAIPKSGSLIALDHVSEKILYLSQSLSFPLARLISRFGGLGLSPLAQAALALTLTTLILAIFYWRVATEELALFMTWWLLPTALLWLTLSYDYLKTGSRLLYLPSVAAALAWGGILLNQKGWRSVLGKVIVVLILFQSLLTVTSLNSLYRAGSELMNEIVDAGQEDKRLLFVNVPDRFEYRQPLYPLGFWGMMFAPVSQQLSDFIYLHSGEVTETLSLSNFPQADDMLTLSPYRVNSRGSDAYGTAELYDSILWADATYRVAYAAHGALDLRPVGTIEQGNGRQEAHPPMARFGQSLNVMDVVTWSADDRLYAETTLQVASPLSEWDTIFVHVVDASGQIVGQADGDSLDGMIPPRAWREGNIVKDIRFIVLNDTANKAPLQLLLGFYNRQDGARLPVSSSQGIETRDDAIVISIDR